MRNKDPLMILQYQSKLKNRNLCGENIWEIVFRQKKIQDIKNRNVTILVSKVEPFGEMYLSRTCIDINNDLTDKYIHAKEENWRSYYKNAFKYAKNTGDLNGISYMNQINCFQICLKIVEIY